MTETTTASAVFPNLDAAKRAVDRVARGGFSRQSIEINRLYSNDEAHEVCVTVREANLQRADDLLHARRKVHDFAADKIDVRPLLMLSGAVAAGALGYSLYALRRSRGSGRQQHPELHLPSVW